MMSRFHFSMEHSQQSSFRLDQVKYTSMTWMVMLVLWGQFFTKMERHRPFSSDLSRILSGNTRTDLPTTMAENSGIGWTDHTHNFWWGCHKVTTECTHCYIDGIMRRAGRVPFAGPMRTVDWSKPHRWERQAQEQG